MTPHFPQPDVDQLLLDAVGMARRAGELLRGRFATEISVQYKGEADPVTEMDRAAQALIEAEVRRLYPGAGILAEEGLDHRGETTFLWVVDPLDGTTNYAHRFPLFSVSIAVLDAGETLCGVVYNPMAEECFTARRYGGAFLNGQPIAVSTTDSLNRSLLGTGFPYDIRQTGDSNLGHFGRFAVRVEGIRRCGSAALDLCFVAAGRLDGYWELNLKPWDVAAGILIVREAGGAVTDFAGRPIAADGSRTLASNGLIHSAMMEVLAGC